MKKQKQKKQRHQTAKTRVEVFRLFKLRDFAETLAKHADPLVVELARRISNEASVMLKPYVEEQQRFIDPQFIDPQKTISELERKLRTMRMMHPAKKEKK